MVYIKVFFRVYDKRLREKLYFTHRNEMAHHFEASLLCFPDSSNQASGSPNGCCSRRPSSLIPKTEAQTVKGKISPNMRSAQKKPKHKVESDASKAPNPDTEIQVTMV